MPHRNPERSDLNAFFDPRSIAVIGSLKEGFFGGYVVIKSLLNAGFKGEIFPVNPSYKEIWGLKVYPSIKDVPQKIDLVLIITGARSVPGILRECIEKGVKAAIVVSDGFAERDEEGKRLQVEIVLIARQGNLRIIGPNTAGVANPSKGVIPNPYEMGYKKVKEGAIAICAQTGMINPQAFPYGDLGYGVSKICDFGNKADVDECDIMEYLENDPATKAIALYLESIKDGQRFLKVSKKVTSKKPVLILKSGRTEQGAHISASHTGSLAQDDRIFDAACRQSGVIRLNTFRELFELPKIFAYQPLPKGNRLGIITFTGAVGVLAIDEGAKYGLSVPLLSPGTRKKLDAIFPGLGKRIVDIGPPMAVVNDYMSIYSEILNTVTVDPCIDSILNVIWTGPSGEFMEEYLKIYRGLQGNRKPIASWVYGPRVHYVNEMTCQLEDMGFPVFPDIEMAIKALGKASQYAKTKGGNR
ncbi:MAG: CoA-binding protein [Deltaproteobacteria bacterium]|nr:CoA-binding protein [Deltaproteobacteria bacterium]